jgi:hypothetical protein
MYVFGWIGGGIGPLGAAGSLSVGLGSTTRGAAGFSPAASADGAAAGWVSPPGASGAGWGGVPAAAGSFFGAWGSAISGRSC